MSLFNTINLKNWIEENKDLLKPPVGNKCVWKDRNFIVMLIGGPNKREDYHINADEEFFYQIKGDIGLKYIDSEGKFAEITIKEGDIYLLPAKVPHSPQRPEGSIGMVIEKKRLPEQEDGFAWYCRKCNHFLYEHYIHVSNIETQLPKVFNDYYSKEVNTTCKKCGHKNTKE